MQKWIRTIRNLIFPQPEMCLLCEKPLSELGLCFACYEKIEVSSLGLGHCQHCHTFGYETEVCDNCRRWPAYFLGNRSLWPYETLVKDCIHKFKFGHEPWRGRALGYLLGENAPPGFDLVIPVPLHRRRMRKRGYNQSLLLAQGVAEVTGLPCYSKVLHRVRNTPHQVGLSREKRKKNLENAFQVKGSEKVQGRRILLIDDVMTTGTTLLTCAKVLHQAGAKEILALTLAAGIN